MLSELREEVEAKTYSAAFESNLYLSAASVSGFKKGERLNVRGDTSEVIGERAEVEAGKRSMRISSCS